MDEQEKENLEAILKEHIPYTVMFPEEYQKNQYVGPLTGYYIEKTKTFNIVSEQVSKVRKDCYLVGESIISGQAFKIKEDTEHFIKLTWNEGRAIAEKRGEDTEVNIEYYSLKKEVFSRNQGILESDQMKNKQAVLAGVGSGNSFVALELAKAGTGSLILIDDDRFSYHNICRHQCGIHDVGKYKVDAIAERVMDINPECTVYVFRDKLQYVDPEALKTVLWKESIILCGADNRHAAYVCNELADQYHVPMIDAGCGQRASTGEIFYYKPDCGMPCYTCAYGKDKGVDYTNQAVRREFYANEAELAKLHFQPGMSLDIGQTAIFETKLAIDLLMENEEGYEAKLLPYIKQCTILMNYPVDTEINPYMKLFITESKNSRGLPLEWKTGPVQKNYECEYCSKK